MYNENKKTKKVYNLLLKLPPKHNKKTKLILEIITNQQKSSPLLIGFSIRS